MQLQLRELDAHQLNTVTELFAFVGNSLLAPITQTEQIGLMPDFWRALPAYTERIDKTLDDLVAFCEKEPTEETLALEVAIDYTRLFVGPPAPLVAPWESLHTAGAESMYSQATVDMKHLLAHYGVQLSDDVHQLEDHIGVELLVLSYLLQNQEVDDQEIVDYIEQRLSPWFAELVSALDQASPGGYYTLLSRLAFQHVRWLLEPTEN